MEKSECVDKMLDELDDYHYDTQEIANEAMENLGRNKEYRRVLDRYDEACRQRNLVKMTQLSARINKMKQQEVHNVILRHEERRKDVNNIAALLSEMDKEEGNRYQELLAGLSLMLDIIDSIFTDINNLLRRNNVGIEMNNFPELKDARKIVWEMISDEQNKMQDYKNKLWSEESERIYSYLLRRCAAYRKKVERIEAKDKSNKETEKLSVL